MVTTSTNTVEPNRLNPIQRAWAVVRGDWSAYLYLNLLYYSLVLLGILYVSFVDPQLQKTLLEAVGRGFTSGPLSAVAEAYTGGKVISAMLLTVVVNLFIGCVIEITLPSLIIPFSGILVGVIRAILWGLILSPSEPTLAGPMIPHSLVLLLEGQGYILAMLAAYIQGKAFLRPQTYGMPDRLRGYREGLRRTGWMYLLVALVLAAAAVYEAFEVIYLAPLFR